MPSNAMDGKYGADMANYDCTLVILKAMRYEDRNTIRLIGYDIYADDSFQPLVDVCLIQREMVLVPVIQEEIGTTVSKRAETRVVIEAANAAFIVNNQVRNELGHTEHDEMMIPCLIMQKTKPTLYLVPVTKGVSKCLDAGEQPKSDTCFYKCAVKHPNASSIFMGMAHPKYRKLAFAAS